MRPPIEEDAVWRCPTCGERHDDAFEVCWQCAGASDDPATDGPDAAAAKTETDPLRCPRCLATLAFAGTKKLHEGTRWGVLGDLGEFFVNRESFDVYVCPRCGRVEFFVDGIGEQYRPH